MNRLLGLVGGLALAVLWFGICFFVVAYSSRSVASLRMGSVMAIVAILYVATMIWAFVRSRGALESETAAARREHKMAERGAYVRSGADPDVVSGYAILEVLLFIPMFAVSMIRSAILESGDPGEE
jgi:hypothetical protein